MKGYKKGILFFGILSVTILACRDKEEKKYTDWTSYGGSKENIKYSSLTQIDTANVTGLQVA